MWVSKDVYYMNVLSKEEPGMTQEIPIEKLQRIAARTTHIVIGAYDGEGFVVWKRSSDAV